MSEQTVDLAPDPPDNSADGAGVASARPRPATRQIENLTPWRLQVGNQVLAPFGKLVGEPGTLPDTSEWETRGYLRTGSAGADTSAMLLDSPWLGVGCLVWLIVLVVVPAGLYGGLTGQYGVPVIAAVASIVVAGTLSWALSTRLRQLVSQSISALGIATVVVVLPVLGVLLFNQPLGELWAGLARDSATNEGACARSPRC